MRRKESGLTGETAGGAVRGDERNEWVGLKGDKCVERRVRPKRRDAGCSEGHVTAEANGERRHDS